MLRRVLSWEAATGLQNPAGASSCVTFSPATANIHGAPHAERCGSIQEGAMRRFLTALIGAAVGLAAAAAAPAHAQDRVTVVRAGRLLDGKSEQARTNQVIVIRGNHIASVGDAASTQVPAGAQVIDLSNATVLPGMIESHTHIFLQGEDPKEGGYDANILFQGLAYRAVRASVSARRALEQGFTTIRDVETEGAGYGDVEIKQAINEGRISGPRMFVVTRAISTTGGYMLEGYAPELDMPKGAQLVDGPVEAQKAAREQLSHGADWIKVYMTHRSWVDRDGNLVSQPTLTLDEIKAIVDEAHGWKKKVACHAYNGIGLHRALDGGCDSIEHGLELDDAAIAQMVRQGTWYCPTLMPYYEWWAPENTPEGKRDRKRVEVHGPSFQKAMRAGVKIVFGTDAGSFKWDDPQKPIANEFGLMVGFGMAPIDAIRSATSRPAEMLDMQGMIGVIAPGAYADLIAVKGDPLADISELKRVGFVMKDGSVFKNELH
jgi:imidazolonepropionase-like amidohydrolase